MASSDEALGTSLTILLDRFEETDRALAHGAPDAVHGHRTAVRRLRSVLTAYGRLLEPIGQDALVLELAAGIARADVDRALAEFDDVRSGLRSAILRLSDTRT